MRKPRKSTLDAFIDQFAEFTLEAQERALDLMQFEHRRAQIRARKETPRSGVKSPPIDAAIVALHQLLDHDALLDWSTPGIGHDCYHCNAERARLSGLEAAAKLDLREPA